MHRDTKRDAQKAEELGLTAEPEAKLPVATPDVVDEPGIETAQAQATEEAKLKADAEAAVKRKKELAEQQAELAKKAEQLRQPQGLNDSIVPKPAPGPAIPAPTPSKLDRLDLERATDEGMSPPASTP